MIPIICVLIGGIIAFIQANFSILFKKMDRLAEDTSHIKANCKFCK